MATRGKPRRAMAQLGIGYSRVCDCGREKPAAARSCRFCVEWDADRNTRAMNVLVKSEWAEVPWPEIPEAVIDRAARFGTLGPVCIELYCNTGGWAPAFLAEGFKVIGYDTRKQPYPGEFRDEDPRYLDGRDLAGAELIVASPPCESFSRHQMPWLRRRNPPPPDLSGFKACMRLAAEAGVPVVMSGVCAAQKWLGSAQLHFGGYFLWGSIPALIPEEVFVATESQRSKEALSSTHRAERSRVPSEISRWIASVFKPTKGVN